jgi:hypothetical protein
MWTGSEAACCSPRRCLWPFSSTAVLGSPGGVVSLVSSPFPLAKVPRRAVGGGLRGDPPMAALAEGTNSDAGNDYAPGLGGVKCRDVNGSITRARRSLRWIDGLRRLPYRLPAEQIQGEPDAPNQNDRRDLRVGLNR